MTSINTSRELKFVAEEKSSILTDQKKDVKITTSAQQTEIVKSKTKFIPFLILLCHIENFMLKFPCLLINDHEPGDTHPFEVI